MDEWMDAYIDRWINRYRQIDRVLQDSKRELPGLLRFSLCSIGFRRLSVQGA